jgi:hypothetical protein
LSGKFAFASFLNVKSQVLQEQKHSAPKRVFTRFSLQVASRKALQAFRCNRGYELNIQFEINHRYHFFIIAIRDDLHSDPCVFKRSQSIS